MSKNQQTKGLAMESIAVPVALTLELHPEGADIGSLERAVSVALAEAGQRLWAELVARSSGSCPCRPAIPAAVASCAPTAGPHGAS